MPFIAAVAAGLCMQAIVQAAPAAEAAAPVSAPTPEPASTNEAGVSEVVVTGTRMSNLKAADSPAPIQILSPQALQAAAGNPDLMTTLEQIVPSLQAEIHGTDMEQLTLQFKLRGLSPNDVLVLVDGKRRHTTANLGVAAGPFQGGAGVDLNFIPTEAIDHIEVLTDGAAAQYGSDAIAGVINIILKKNASGGKITGLYGGFYDGGGGTDDVDGNAGFAPSDNSFLNVTGSVHNHGTTLRSGPDPRALRASYLDTYPTSNMTQVAGWPYVNLIDGDGEYHTKVASLNSGIDFTDTVAGYLYSTYGNKHARTNQNYRLPNQAQYTESDGTVDYPLPYGFQPSEYIEETDFQVTGGFKGTLTGFNWDIGSTYGRDRVVVSTLNTINSGVFNMNGKPQPSNFYDGTLKASQWATTLDVSRPFEVGLAGPLNVAFGAEYRRDTYGIEAGQDLSWEAGGAQSFPGWTPSNAVSVGRTNYAGYAELDFRPVEPLLMVLAGRYEHYSDFGDAKVGKFSARYDFSPAFALRGTVSNGFRAPTLAEEYYESTNVSPTAATVQLAPNSPVAAQLGLGQGLQPERSVNYSLGFVWRPIAKLITTLDLYQITLTNRVVATSTLTGELNGETVSQPVIDAIVASGAPVNNDVSNYGISLFTNGIDSRTRGADLSFTLPTDYSFGHVDWSASGNYNQTTITGMRDTPAIVQSTDPAKVTNPLFGPSTVDALTTEAPKYRIDLGAHLTSGKLTVDLLEKLYGPSSARTTDSGYIGQNPNGTTITGPVSWFTNTVHFAPITNWTVGWQLLDHLRVEVGALNLFNRYPTPTNPTLIQRYKYGYSTAAMAIWPGFAPFGDDGGYYFAKATYTW
jgi:iron complex outermembrane receptor protein